MSPDDTRDLIGALADDLTPVRPIASLRAVGMAIVVAWLAVAGVGVAVLGLRPDWIDVFLMPSGIAVIFGSLGLAGLGGIVAALATAVPGREALARVGLGVGLLGLALSAGLASMMVAQHPPAQWSGLGSSELRCLAVACAIGLLPALGVVAFVGRAAAFRPLAAVLGAAAGTAALGAVAAEASCPTSDPVHMLLGHVLGPVAGVLVLTLPLLFALRRLSR